MWEVAKHERWKEVAGDNSQVQLSNSKVQQLLLFTLIVDGCTAKTMDEITKYKLQKFVAERYDRNTGKFYFAQHITFQHKVFQSN